MTYDVFGGTLNLAQFDSIYGDSNLTLNTKLPVCRTLVVSILLTCPNIRPLVSIRFLDAFHQKCLSWFLRIEYFWNYTEWVIGIFY